MSVRQAQLEISSPEFCEWMAYFELEPFGEQVADQRHGIATSWLVNLNLGKDSKAFVPGDFIPWGDAAPEVEAEPELLDDPVAQSNLIRAAMFGLPPKSSEVS